MGTLLITGAILALATVVFTRFWEAVIEFCVKLVLSILEAFVTFVKTGYRICAYLYRRKYDGWYKQEVEVERVSIADCPLSVRNALFDHDEVIVKRY